MASDSCPNCCAVLSLLGIVHLLLFGGMFRARAVSFHITSVENGWDIDEKARACFNGAIFYGVTLFVSVAARIYTRRSQAAREALLEAERLRERAELHIG
ncbi:uncharacterized protein Tco025E_02002 [Trypanosoma conorhini]|uniref:Uncharacterized protein n=1 Tax=Trypanosoma conorhini TaxID=83891 RepID=A0A3R7M3B4_9TRYP|nr:uncharacterized protein Tco025E_02002 [Trypanosoma conorhini]RNF25791.1 hypothetical protein Tco025E_02002 [Trypanosoma conorhini]